VEGTERLTATGLSVGTPAYMSPEQAAGSSELDGRTDIYSLGCVVYEMLAGQPPFTGTTPQSVIARRFAEPAPSVAALRDSVPPAVEQAVARALEREPADRYSSASDFAAALAWPPAGSRGTPARRRRVRPAAAIAVCAAVALGAALWYPRHHRRAAEVRWATHEAIPAIRALADSGRWDSAYVLAMRASAVIPGDSALSKLWPRFADTFSVLSHPPGARVYRRNYSAPNAGWTLLGTTPLTATRFPFRLSRIRLEMDGRRPLDAAVEPFGLARTVFELNGTAADSTMVRVPGGEVGVGLPGLDHLEPVALGDFLIGRY